MRFTDFKISSFVALTSVLVTGFMLFNVSQQVQESERQLKRVQNDIEREREMIRVLEAEWAYLNRPDRLEHLAQQYLGMEAMDSEAVFVTPANLPDKKLYMPPPARPERLSNIVSVSYKAPSKTVDVKPQESLANTHEINRDFRSILTALERRDGSE